MEGPAHALDNYDFDLVLRIDDDALVIDRGYEYDAMERFGNNPNVGLLGSYRITCTGNVRDFLPPAKILEHEMSPSGAFADPARCAILRQPVSLAEETGYQRGENCLGAACFFCKKVLHDIRDRGFLGRHDLASSKLCDDHLFSLIVMATGYLIDDFATEGHPLGLAWRGLPASPAALVAMKKKIVHSVRSFGTMDEKSVRAEFKRLLREQHG
jgi:hypothetical protein